MMDIIITALSFVIVGIIGYFLGSYIVSKSLLNRCKNTEVVIRDVPYAHPIVEKPWGYYEVMATNLTTSDGLNNKVKLLIVNPGHILSLQRHNFRSERWMILTGEATITLGKELESLEEFTMYPGSTIFIDIREIHRIENKGIEQVTILEVQTGTDLRESDIERIVDYYGRIKN